MRTRLFPLALPATALVAALVSSSTLALAEPSKEDIAKADALFRDAQLLVQKGQLAEGCAKFAESQAIDPANGTLLNLALCHEKEGKVATAYRELQELLAIMQNSKNPDDRERSRVATERIRQLEKKLPRVTFDIAALRRTLRSRSTGRRSATRRIRCSSIPGGTRWSRARTRRSRARRRSR